MKKVQNILWISMVLSGVLFCISMKGENLDMMAFSVGIAIIAVILNIPFLRYGDNKKLTSDFLHRNPHRPHNALNNNWSICISNTCQYNSRSLPKRARKIKGKLII